MKLGFVSQDRAMSYGGMLGGAGVARIGTPAMAMSAAGHEVREGICVWRKGGALGVIPVEVANAPDAERVAAAWFPDVIVMQRYMHAGMPHAIRVARAEGQVVINDVDDLFDAVPPSNNAFRGTHPKTSADNNVNHYRSSLAASSMVTVSTPFLAERIRAYMHDTPVVVIRNAIVLGRFAPHEHHEPPRLGWVGSLSHRANDVEELRGITSALLDVTYDKRFVHCGATQHDHMHSVLGLDVDEVDEYPMVPNPQYPGLLDAIDVGVVPLSSHPFNVAKSCIKGMEYAAAGIPFVATDTPEYLWLYSTHGIGRLAHRPKDWLRQLRALSDPEQRAAEAREQREHLRPLDISVRWRDWEQAYESATA